MNIPPLSQSRESKMACDELYAVTEIDGVEMPPSNPSDRGEDVHHVMAQYALHCASLGVPSDWDAFDGIAGAVGTEAGQIVDGMRDNLVVDYEHLFCVEQRLFLDGNLQALVCQENSPMSRKACYAGKPDALYFLNDPAEEPTSAYIQDFKSHWRPFDADTFQAKLYPFLVMQNYPTVQDVKFELIFTRYRDARRSVVYTRVDLPKMAQEIERARNRQIGIHNKIVFGALRSTADALPGAHCIYCPHLAKGTCPLGDSNPYGTMTLEDRLKHVVQIDQARKFHMGIIKDYVDNSLLPVSFEDGSGQKYEAAFRPTESGYFPLVETTATLMEYAEANPDDKTLFNGLRVGSSQLKPKLKAKKRVDLDQRLRDSIMVKETAVRFGIKGVEEEEEEG